MTKLFWDVPGGQPNTNYELHRRLHSETGNVYGSRSAQIGETGYTWWVMAELDDAVYQQKYNGLNLVNNPETNPHTTLGKLIAFAGPSCR